VPGIKPEHDKMVEDKDIDKPLWGAEAIGREANVVDEDGNVDLRKVYYLLENELLPGTKVGKLWTSTKRRIRRVFAGEAA
jgi:hypothetical protein